jgi:hypothetical protein
MSFDEQDPRSNVMGGRIIVFLRRNLFQVQLDNGQYVTAAMPEKLLPWGRASLEQPPGQWINVKVRLKKFPRMHRIVAASEGGLTGGVIRFFQQS